MESLLGVVEALKIDLYNVDVENDGNMDDNDLDKMLFSSAIKTNTINNFQKAYVETADEEDAESKDTWSQAIKKWQSQGWEVKALESEDCPHGDNSQRWQSWQDRYGIPQRSLLSTGRIRG